MLQIAVCDNDLRYLRHTGSIIKKVLSKKSVQIFSFPSAEAMLDSIQQASCSPDIAVLETTIKGISGISLAEQLNRTIPNCQVIFLTSCADHASEVYLTKHVWFILKDKIDTYLTKALERAIANLTVPESGMVSIRSSGKMILISIQDVIFLEHVGRKTRIVCKDAAYLSSKQPTMIQQRLTRCHQGYWANLAHVSALDHNEFVMDDGTRIPISRSYRANARSQFFDLIRA